MVIYDCREKVISVLVKAMKNPRSVVCKTSIMASSDVFDAYGNKLLQLDGVSDGFDQLEAFEAAYEDMTSNVPRVREAAITEIAKMSIRSVELDPSPVQLTVELRAYCFKHSDLPNGGGAIQQGQQDFAIVSALLPSIPSLHLNKPSEDELIHKNRDRIAVFQLLLKSSQDKRFVCEEANKALKSMVHVVSPPLLLMKLKTYIGHSNLRVRAKATVCISHCVSKMVSPIDLKTTIRLELKDYGSASLLQMAAELLNDRLPEAREAAQSIATTLYESFAKEHDKGEIQESWRSYYEANLPALHAQPIVKVTVGQ
ncbi:hypothetical protein Droror1_Dr00020580 [Drosera rotundifolia]